MKKIVFALALILTGAVLAQVVKETKIIETTTAGGTNFVYIGTALVSSDDALAPAVTDRKWSIKRIATAADGTVTTSYGFNAAVGGSKGWDSNIWTNRATTNVTYKTAQ